MKQQRNRNYNKALKYYESGYIDKALSYLELSISENLKNKGALNLKGLLLYLRGDLENAITTWKINYEFNDDKIAKGYINDSIKDRERLDYYNKADNLLKQLKLDEAIGYLNKCKESDFNSIKVNIALAMCYFKKGRYEESSVYISRALTIEKNNKICIKIAKELKEYTDIKIINAGKDYKKVIISFASIAILLFGVIGVYRWVDNKNNMSKSDSNEITSSLVKESEGEEAEVSETNNEKEDIDANEINIEEFQSSLENNDYDKVYSIVENLKNQEVKAKEKALYVKGVELLKIDGVKFFYEEGMKAYNNNEFVKARTQLNKAYQYGETSYLYPHILFFNGAVGEKVGDKESKKYYSDYIESYSEEENTYVEESLYRLSILYKEEDIDKSMYYAKVLNEKYPKSIYNNDVIKGILKLNN